MASPKTTGHDIRTVWNHTFEWTDKHFTSEDLLPLRQQADYLGVSVVEKLQTIAAEEKKSGKALSGRTDMYAILKTHRHEDEIL